jgi:GAF domain-containing protein
MPDNQVDDELTQLRRTVASQAAELEHYRQSSADAQLMLDLHGAFIQAAVAGTIAAPVSHSRLLEMVVETAARVIDSRAAALFLLDEAHQELVFEIALGQKAEEVKEFRVPLGHGIAGLVAATGQPMATSGTTDPRQARDIAERVGYVPNTIVCVPLFYAERVIGVLELLDKADGASFSMLDIHALGLFANLAAVALEQSRTRDHLTAAIAETLKDVGKDVPEPQRRALETSRLRLADSSWLEDKRYEQALGLARLVEEISRSGDRELAACHAILREFAEYLRSRTRPIDSMLDLGLGRL